MSVVKSIRALFQGMSVYFDFIALFPTARGHIVPHTGHAPYDYGIRLKFVKNLIERVFRLVIILRSAGFTRSVHGCLLVIVERK